MDVRNAAYLVYISVSDIMRSEHVDPMDLSMVKNIISVDTVAVRKELQFLKYFNDHPVYYQPEHVRHAIYRQVNEYSPD